MTPKQRAKLPLHPKSISIKLESCDGSRVNREVRQLIGPHQGKTIVDARDYWRVLDERGDRGFVHQTEQEARAALATWLRAMADNIENPAFTL